MPHNFFPNSSLGPFPKIAGKGPVYLCNFGRGHYEEHFTFEPVVQEQMSF